MGGTSKCASWKETSAKLWAHTNNRILNELSHTCSELPQLEFHQHIFLQGSLFSPGLGPPCFQIPVIIHSAEYRRCDLKQTWAVWDCGSQWVWLSFTFKMATFCWVLLLGSFTCVPQGTGSMLFSSKHSCLSNFFLAVVVWQSLTDLSNVRWPFQADKITHFTYSCCCWVG